MPPSPRSPSPAPPRARGTPAPLCFPRTINPCPGCCPRAVVLSPRSCTGGLRGDGGFWGPSSVLVRCPGKAVGRLVPGSVPGTAALLGDPYRGRCWYCGWVTVRGGTGDRGSAEGQSRDAAAVPGLDAEARGSTVSGSWDAGAGTEPVPGCRCRYPVPVPGLGVDRGMGPGRPVRYRGQCKAAGASTGESPAVLSPGPGLGPYRGLVQRAGVGTGVSAGARAASEADPGVGADVGGGS